MFVCVCNAVTDRDIKLAVREGADLPQVCKQLGVGSCCGRCVPCARECVEQARSECVDLACAAA